MAKGSLLKAKGVRPVGYRFPVGLLTTKEAADFVANPDSMITTTNATKTDSTDHVIYSWTTSGTFEQTGSRNLTSDMLIVAGGGAGHSNHPSGGGMGGGGAGGLLYYSDLPGLTGPPGPASANSKTPNGPTVSIAPTVEYTITVGAGGAGYYPAGEPASPPFPADVSGLVGGPSSFSNTSPDIPTSDHLDLTSTGGGTMWSTSSLKNGGSGAGTYAEPAGTGIAGQGNPGAISSNPSFTGGGGGGAGSEGTTMADTQPRSGKDGGSAPTNEDGRGPTGVYRYASGGDGLDFDISGTRRTYAAGGGGSGRGVAAYGGSDNLGGQGSGGTQLASSAGGNATVSRGSGGGGGTPGGNGSSGVVIMKISKNSPWLFSVN